MGRNTASGPPLATVEELKRIANLSALHRLTADEKRCLFSFPEYCAAEGPRFFLKLLEAIDWGTLQAKGHSDARVEGDGPQNLYQARRWLCVCDTACKQPISITGMSGGRGDVSGGSDSSEQLLFLGCLDIRFTDPVVREFGEYK